jgi:hypothetical protein
MSGHGVNGRRVVMLGTWEIADGAGNVLGRVNAIDAERALRRAAKKWGVSAEKLTVVAVLPTVWRRETRGSDGKGATATD